MVAEAVEAWGRLDVLVNNAGIQHTALIEDFPHDKWEAVIAINLSAAFYAMQAAIPVMKRKAWGRIINIASAHGLVASAQKAAYVAAKHGLVGLTKTRRHRTGEHRHHLQCDMPWLGPYAIGAKADRDACQGKQSVHRAGAGGASRGKAAHAPVHYAGEDRRPMRVSLLRRCGDHDRRAALDRWWLDRGLSRRKRTPNEHSCHRRSRLHWLSRGRSLAGAGVNRSSASIM